MLYEVQMERESRTPKGMPPEYVRQRLSPKGQACSHARMLADSQLLNSGNQDLPDQTTVPTPDKYPAPETGRLKQKVLTASMPAVSVAEVALEEVVYVVMS